MAVACFIAGCIFAGVGNKLASDFCFNSLVVFVGAYSGTGISARVTAAWSQRPPKQVIAVPTSAPVDKKGSAT